ncbi:hypothetical protein H6G41_04515 [Tolypothrix sp. FACHB-123]|uniref:hypothetical protein n=1 Tax=Tolypothrix sp. FACHB-123 TaxID=2692868 RepID=UPI001686DC6C|nr:hypothetical protein [Tolypothrix sp. FACHB-123]MBD2353889.1 hypothetical protein [Tolypothrix sp. FACHB-123]
MKPNKRPEMLGYPTGSPSGDAPSPKGRRYANVATASLTAVATLRERFQRTSRGTRPTQCLTAPRLRSSNATCYPAGTPPANKPGNPSNAVAPQPTPF